MIRILFLIAAVCLSVCAAQAQAKKLPTFSQYAVKAEKIKPAKVNINTPDTRAFRTRLREAAREGVNFAGRFVIAAWGCGTGCLNGVVIDGKTGKVYFPKSLSGFGLGYGDWTNNHEALEFKPNSKLLIINGFIGGDDERQAEGKYYLLWTGTDFKRLAFRKQQGENER